MTTTASLAPNPASAGSTVSVSGPDWSLPVLPGAQVIDGTDKGALRHPLRLGQPVRRLQVLHDGVAAGRLHDNHQFPGNRDSFSGTGIWFTGHGFNGQIGALSSFRIPAIRFGGNTVEITLTPAIRPRPVPA